MKKSSIVIALSLLAMSTLATADEFVKLPISSNSNDSSRLVVNPPSADIKLKYTFDTPDAKFIMPTPITKEDTLLPWKELYYRNFKETYVKFYTTADCISARNYATEKIGGRLIGKTGSDRYQVGYKLDNSVETRISCVMKFGRNPNLPKSADLTDVFVLYYQTAEKLSNEEVIKADDEAKRRKEELKVQHENSIKSQIDTLLLNAK